MYFYLYLHLLSIRIKIDIKGPAAGKSGQLGVIIDPLMTLEMKMKIIIVCDAYMTLDIKLVTRR